MRRGAASEVLVEGRLWIPATVPLVVGGEADTDATPATALGAVSTPATAFALLVAACSSFSRAATVVLATSAVVPQRTQKTFCFSPPGDDGVFCFTPSL